MNNTVTQKQIDEIIENGKVEVMTLGEKTTLVKFTSKDGFEIIETSSCVSPENYNEEIGKGICIERIKNKLWAFEGYCLQRELYKLKKKSDGMTFGEAFEQVKQGKGMRLPKWSPDVVIRAQYPDENSKMTAPYLYVKSRYGRVLWKDMIRLTSGELFSNEWQVVD